MVPVFGRIFLFVPDMPNQFQLDWRRTRRSLAESSLWLSHLQVFAREVASMRAGLRQPAVTLLTSWSSVPDLFGDCSFRALLNKFQAHLLVLGLTGLGIVDELINTTG